ncbi:uncharacterized protein [Asterias amurensis]|uniref:uncharacterized protein n=1 Tax=Asterias amurensis TaxID=7602 RepID=UPI003AB23F73
MARRESTPVQESKTQHISAFVRSNGFYATTDLPFRVTKETNWDCLSDEIFKTIHDISLSDCKLSTVPLAIASMTQLTRLYLTYNDMSKLPKEFADLINLQILNLGFNSFKEIPDVVFELRELKVLYLKNNSITSDGVGPHLQNLINLEELYLGNNQLETFPESACKLKEIRLLSLSSNRIRAVPPTIKEMKNLTVLIMRSNRLQRVPGVIGGLTSLESLCFAQNMITVFPFDELDTLQKLRDLCLHGNRLDNGEILKNMSTKLAERECMLRAEENRVALPRRGGVCDGVFKVWHNDFLWIHDGGKSVTTWIGEVSELLKTKQLSSKDCNVSPSSQDITSAKDYSNTSRVVCVVCTQEMCDLLKDDTNSTAKIVKSVIEYRASSSISVIFDKTCDIAQMLFRLTNRDNIIFRHESENNNDMFCKELIKLMDQIIGQRMGPLCHGRH